MSGSSLMTMKILLLIMIIMEAEKKISRYYLPNKYGYCLFFFQK